MALPPLPTIQNRPAKPPATPPPANQPSSPVYATRDEELADKPVYDLAKHDPLPYAKSPRGAACNVMILLYAAKSHAESFGLHDCPQDVADLIRRDLDAIGVLLPKPQQHEQGDLLGLN